MGCGTTTMWDCNDGDILTTALRMDCSSTTYCTSARGRKWRADVRSVIRANGLRERHPPNSLKMPCMISCTLTRGRTNNFINLTANTEASVADRATTRDWCPWVE